MLSLPRNEDHSDPVVLSRPALPIHQSINPPITAVSDASSQQDCHPMPSQLLSSTSPPAPFPPVTHLAAGKSNEQTRLRRQRGGKRRRTRKKTRQNQKAGTPKRHFLMYASLLPPLLPNTTREGEEGVLLLCCPRVDETDLLPTPPQAAPPRSSPNPGQSRGPLDAGGRKKKERQRETQRLCSLLLYSPRLPSKR